MSIDDEQRSVPTEMTRREAMAKIAKYGAFVPATLAVLSAAPRAFAQSQSSTLVITGQLWCFGPVHPRQLGLALGDPSNEPSQIEYADSLGQFRFSLDVPVGSSDSWFVLDTLYDNAQLANGDYPPLTHNLGQIEVCP